MAQWLRTLVPLPEDLSSISSTLRRCLKSPCNFSSRGSDTLFCSLQVSTHYTIHVVYRYTCIHIKKKSFFKKFILMLERWFRGLRVLFLQRTRAQLLVPVGVGGCL